MNLFLTEFNLGSNENFILPNSELLLVLRFVHGYDLEAKEKLKDVAVRIWPISVEAHSFLKFQSMHGSVPYYVDQCDQNRP